MVSARALVESATRGWVLRRRMGPQFGNAPMYVSPSAGLRYLFKPLKDADPLLTGLAAEFVKPGAVVWDIGANVGLFSTAAAHLAGPSGRVVAVEPDPFLVQLLRRTAREQGGNSARITVVPSAVATEFATREFVLAKRSNATNYLAEYGTSQTGGVLDTVTVVTVPLDWLLTQQPKPDVVKIDVEGAEVEVLSGANKLFESSRPTVVLETQPGTSPWVTSFFHERGYRLFDAGHSGVRVEVKSAPWATIAIPA